VVEKPMASNSYQGSLQELYWEIFGRYALTQSVHNHAQQDLSEVCTRWPVAGLTSPAISSSSLRNAAISSVGAKVLATSEREGRRNSKSLIALGDCIEGTSFCEDFIDFCGLEKEA
jgi:hypothetical protein